MLPASHELRGASGGEGDGGRTRTQHEAIRGTRSPRGRSGTATAVPARSSALFACKLLGKSRGDRWRQSRPGLLGPRLEGRCHEPAGTSQRRSRPRLQPGEGCSVPLCSAFPPREPRTALALVAPAGKFPSANPAQVEKSLIFLTMKLVVTPCPGAKRTGAAPGDVLRFCAHGIGDVLKSPVPKTPSQSAPPRSGTPSAAP